MEEPKKDRKVLMFLKSKMVFILALILISSGLYDLYGLVVSGNLEGLTPMISSLTASVRIIMGMCILFDPRRGLLRAVGFYAFALGFSRFLSSVPNLLNENVFMFFLGLVFLAMGANLMYSGYNYLNETSRSRNGMTMTAAALALLQIIILYVNIRFNSLPMIQGFISDVPTTIILIFQYVTLLVIMDTEELRFGSSNERANSRVERIRTSYTLEFDMSMPIDQAMVIRHMFDDRSSWSPVSDSGPVECEKRIHVIDRRISSWMILQKWYGSEKIYFTVVNDDDASIIAANRFAVSDVVPDKPSDDDFTYLRLFDDGRLLSQIWVHRMPEEEGTGQEDGIDIIDRSEGDTEEGEE